MFQSFQIMPLVAIQGISFTALECVGLTWLGLEVRKTRNLNQKSRIALSSRQR